MPLFTPAASVALFWKWWPKERDKIRAEVEAGQAHGKAHMRLHREIAYLDRNMRWVIEDGSWARHRLVLRPLGDPNCRLAARLWLESAPKQDASWEFGVGLPPRPVTETLRLATIDGAPVLVEDLADYLHLDEADTDVDDPDAGEEDLLRRFSEASGLDVEVETVALADLHAKPSWDADAERFDVRVWHPAFAHIDSAEAETLGAPAIATMLGDEDEARWLGGVVVDPNLQDGLDLPALRAWVDRQVLTATGDRWVTARHRDQGNRRVAVRFNAARKEMDDPVWPSSNGLLVVLHRNVADVEAPEAERTLAVLRDLESRLSPGTARLVEVSEAGRLSVVYVSADRKADGRAAKAWAKGLPKLQIDVETDVEPRWIKQMGLTDLRLRPDTGWDSAPKMKTRPDGRLYRRAKWIERHPWRLLSAPISAAIGAIVLGIALPSAARDAALLLIGVAGVGGVALSTYVASSTYVTFRNNPALGFIALLFDGWKILVTLGISLVLILIYLDVYLSG